MLFFPLRACQHFFLRREREKERERGAEWGRGCPLSGGIEGEGVRGSAGCDAHWPSPGHFPAIKEAVSGSRESTHRALHERRKGHQIRTYVCEQEPLPHASCLPKPIWTERNRSSVMRLTQTLGLQGRSSGRQSSSSSLSLEHTGGFKLL